jgi:hypothetical protein
MRGSGGSVVRFAVRIALFWLPVVVVFGLLEVGLWRTGESWPVDRVLDVQQRQPDAIFMRGLLDQSFYAYKWRGVLRSRPRVLALGSSRVLKFRRTMFGTESGVFYNAGGLVTNVGDLEAFAERLPPEPTPQVLILGIDLWWLNPAHAPGDEFLIEDDGAWSWQGHLLALRTLLGRPSAIGPLFRPQLFPHPEGIGVIARRRGEGFRPDGSLESNLPLPQTAEGWAFVDREKPPILRSIRRGVGFFEPAEDVAAPRLERLQRALTRLRSRGIQVIGFAPPICSEGVRLLDTEPRQSGLWNAFRSRVAAVFAAEGLSFFDASSPDRLGLDDRYMIDGIHAEETFHVHLLRRMLDDPRLAALLPGTLPVLDAALSSPKTNFWHAELAPPASPGSP